MKYFQEDGLIIKSWCENPEDGAIEQAKNLAKLPFAFKQICLMPDTHQGYGMPVGGVLATKDIVIPNAVGVNIACGMNAEKTTVKEITTDQLKIIMGKIRKEIPVGFNHHKKEQEQKLMPEFNSLIGYDYEVGMYGNKHLLICMKEYKNALTQLGTLGSGNHFLEIQRDEKSFIWIMVHSGSRNLGKQVADHYNKVAVELNKKWHSKIPKEWQLAFLPIDSEEGQSYLKEMNYCVDFAFANRKLMMDRVKEIIIGEFKDTIFEPAINIAHNYARMENHFGQNVMVHRKGATSARKDEIGIIPGSQGTSSYIVRGLGNPESFMSCSHGAGRKMSRTEAKKTLNLEEEIKKLDDQGIIHGIRHIEDLDEAAGSYKNVEIVIAEQIDLVDIVHKLQPLAVIKG